MSFVALGWIDTWALCSTLRRNQADLVDSGEGFRHFDLMGEDAAQPKWKAAINVVTRARRTLRQAEKMIPALAAFAIADAGLEWIDAGANLRWAGMPHDEIRIEIAVLTNPLAVVYAWPEMCHLAVGEVLAIPGARNLHFSAVNFGETPRCHLCLRLRARAPGFTEEEMQ